MSKNTLNSIYAFLNRNKASEPAPKDFKSREEWKKELGVKDSQFSRIIRALGEHKAVESIKLLRLDEKSNRIVSRTYFKFSQDVLKGRSKRR